MEIRVTQCQVGRFNLLSSEKTLEFSCGLYTDGKLIEEDGVKAILKYSGEPDMIDYFTSLDNLDAIFSHCFEFGSRISSSTDYVSQCLLFARLFRENYEPSVRTALPRKLRSYQP
ncbi:MAG: hypothetical protein EOP50_22875 [Sphingobacteriales bacterium]|nr:MAG: hypothetical protein EOP50_22875 [Sphingobacteriales bacterium]